MREAPVFEALEKRLQPGAGPEDIAAFEESMRPLFTAMPKHGGVMGLVAVKYILDRAFAERYGWAMRGIHDDEKAWRSPGEAAEAFRSRVEDNELMLHGLETRLERGIGLREIAVLAAALESTANAETAQRLLAAYRLVVPPNASSASSAEGTGSGGSGKAVLTDADISGGVAINDCPHEAAQVWWPRRLAAPTGEATPATAAPSAGMSEDQTERVLDAFLAMHILGLGIGRAQGAEGASSSTSTSSSPDGSGGEGSGAAGENADLADGAGSGGETVEQQIGSAEELFEKASKDLYPHWTALKAWAREVRREVLAANVDKLRAAGATQVGAADSLAPASFPATELVAEELSKRYGLWRQREECEVIRKDLVSMERDDSGSVKLDDFYYEAADKEDPSRLSNLEVLDESDPSHPKVLIANYMGSASNCRPVSRLYSACCRDECQSLFASLERALAVPDAMPGQILEVVDQLTSKTVTRPRMIPAKLVKELEHLARGHHGKIPIHSSFFRQWMHSVFPRECPFLHHLPGQGKR